MCIWAKPHRRMKSSVLAKLLLRLLRNPGDEVRGDSGGGQNIDLKVQRTAHIGWYRISGSFASGCRRIRTCIDRWNWGQRFGRAAARRQKSSVMVRGSRLPSRMRTPGAAVQTASSRSIRGSPVLQVLAPGGDLDAGAPRSPGSPPPPGPCLGRRSPAGRDRTGPRA